MAKAFYSTPELAELLGVFHSTVRRWIEREQVKGFRVGRNYKIPAVEVVRMLDQHGLGVPKSMTGTRLKREKVTPTLSLRKNASGSILKRLLAVEDIKEPALVCRHDTILGTNKSFADLAGYSQIDLIGVRLNEVIEDFAGLGKSDAETSKLHFLEEDQRECDARVKRGDDKMVAVTMNIEGVDGMKNVFLLAVTRKKRQ